MVYLLLTIGNIKCDTDDLNMNSHDFCHRYLLKTDIVFKTQNLIDF